MKTTRACQRGIHVGNVDSVGGQRRSFAEVVRNRDWRNWEKFGQSNKKWEMDSKEWPHAQAGEAEKPKRCWWELRAQWPDSSWNVTALERWRRSKAAEVTSGKNSRVVAPLGEEVNSLFHTSVRKAEKALAARDFDGNASALGSPLVGRSAQSLAKTQPGEDEWHARRSRQDWPRACIAENTSASAKVSQGVRSSIDAHQKVLESFSNSSISEIEARCQKIWDRIAHQQKMQPYKNLIQKLIAAIWFITLLPKKN
jgi:hypothetical protein